MKNTANSFCDRIIEDENDGYNDEEIRSFIPAARRIAEFACSKENCPKFSTCDHQLDKM